MNKFNIARNVLEIAMGQAETATEDFDLWEIKARMKEIIAFLGQDEDTSLELDLPCGEARIIRGEKGFKEAIEHCIFGDPCVFACWGDAIEEVTKLPAEVVKLMSETEAYKALDKLMSNYYKDEEIKNSLIDHVFDNDDAGQKEFIFGSYDGNFEETEIGGEKFYIFRTN